MQYRPIATFAFLSLLATGAAIADDGWRSKVDPWVLDRAASAEAVEVLVVLAEQADVGGARQLRDKQAKGRYVFERLAATAARTQPAVIAALRERGVEHRPYWIANMIWVQADEATVEAVAQRGDVARISANPRVRIESAVTPKNAGGDGCPATVEQSLIHVGAPDFWNAGFLGDGIVIAGHDTGYDWDHIALRDTYRGWDGASADHNYNWHDAIHSGGGICGPDSPEPCDDHGHGTHTMGTMVGDDGTHRVGMAPGARWMGCRNMDQGNGTPATYSECFQFFLAPTDSNGANPDPDRAPHVINNSWACTPSEGCTDPNILLTVVENVRAAGIMNVVSTGNSGPQCSSVNAPTAIYDAVFSVGATNNSDNIIAFSSRGPVTVDGSMRLKPDITAPGGGICSSFPGDTYGSISGTSMAGPHVAGLVALLLDAAACLAGDPDGIEAWLRDTAAPQTTLQVCGGVDGSEVPNNTYGHGALRAVLPPAGLCSSVFSDGFESGDTTGWTPPF